jgi:hypothetical protein
MTTKRRGPPPGSLRINVSRVIIPSPTEVNIKTCEHSEKYMEIDEMKRFNSNYLTSMLFYGNEDSMDTKERLAIRLRYIYQISGDEAFPKTSPIMPIMASTFMDMSPYCAMNYYTDVLGIVHSYFKKLVYTEMESELRQKMLDAGHTEPLVDAFLDNAHIDKDGNVLIKSHVSK